MSAAAAAFFPSFTAPNSGSTPRFRTLLDSLPQSLGDIGVSILERVAAVESGSSASTQGPLPPSIVGYVDALDDRFCEISEGEFIAREYSLRASQVLEHYRDLKNSWDGDEALAPSAERLNAAETFLHMLVSNIDVCPEVSAMLDDEGVPGLFWDTGSAYFSVSFYDDCELVCMYCNRATSERMLFEADLFKPEEVVQVFERIESLQ